MATPFECLRRFKVSMATPFEGFNVYKFMFLKQPQTISNHFKQPQTISNNFKQPQTTSNNLKPPQTILNHLTHFRPTQPSSHKTFRPSDKNFAPKIKQTATAIGVSVTFLIPPYFNAVPLRQFFEKERRDEYFEKSMVQDLPVRISYCTAAPALQRPCR